MSDKYKAPSELNLTCEKCEARIEYEVKLEEGHDGDVFYPAYCTRESCSKEYAIIPTGWEVVES